MSTASVRTLDAACLECGADYRVNPCHADEHKFCSGRCRAKWHREHPRARRRVKAGTPLRPTALRALGRLQKGPATGLDLFRAGAGMRYGARLLELRRAGHQIGKRQISYDPDVWLYTLEVAEATTGQTPAPSLATQAAESMKDSASIPDASR